MRTVHTLLRPVPLASVLVALAASVGLASPGWILGSAVAVVATTLVLGALALLVGVFGREDWWSWRHRHDDPERAAARGHSWGRTATRGAVALGGTAVGWFALTGPTDLDDLTPIIFARIPLEALLLTAVALVLPRRPRAMVAVAGGAVLGIVAIVKVLDMGFRQALDRPVDLLFDARYLPSAATLLGDSIGPTAAGLVIAGASLAAAAAVVLTPVALLRAAGLVARHRARSVGALATLGLVWALFAGLGVQVRADAPVAATSVVDVARDQVRIVQDGIEDRRAFAEALAVDRFRETPAADLLSGLRGKNVLIVFVESYGRVAVEDPDFRAAVGALLDRGTQRLEAAGFGSRSGFLTSPTFGGISWLAHSTLQSGVWVDHQDRYDTLLASDRLTLSRAFDRAGWRTVADVPSNRWDWPEGRAFYGFDEIYDSRNTGYAGPKFSYAAMPDQYVLSAFHRLELAEAGAGPSRSPVMAEIDLVSSHTPWVPLPQPVDWDEVGDGSVFDAMPEAGLSPDDVWPDPEAVRTAYLDSVAYSLETVISFVATYGNDDLVLVLLGDHQPATIISGDDPSHDVPISLIAHDPAVLERIDGWGWQPGLRPPADAPLWPMDAFRDRFLTAFSAVGSQ